MKLCQEKVSLSDNKLRQEKEGSEASFSTF